MPSKGPDTECACKSDLASDGVAQVNKIREIPQHPSLVVTHTDAPELLLWNVDKQPHRPREKVGFAR